MNSKALEEIYVRMWKSDIIHVLIEVLREDFSTIDGEWCTASELTSLLARICSFVKPLRSSNPEALSTFSLESFNDEELEEYYDILVPTAVDSLLIVANNIHENNHEDLPVDGLALNLEYFKLTLSSLCQVCSVHTQYITRIIQSPYLLHLMVTDSQPYALEGLAILHELIMLKEDKITPTNELQSLLDELVFKIGGTDESLAMSSLSLLALLSANNSTTLDLICDKYKGLSVLLQKWKSSFDGPLKNFAQTLLERVKVSDEDYIQDKAAVIIQAGWKGFCTRKKMLKAKRGIIKFQRLYRLRKARKVQENAKKVLNNSAQSIRKFQSTRERHEREKEILEQIPAVTIDSFLSKREKSAAMKIQSWWRQHRGKNKIDSNNIIKQRSAEVIQRAYREYSKGKCKHVQQSAWSASSPRYTLPPLTAIEREQLNAEIPFIKKSKAGNFNEKELFSLLDWFYRSREEQREADRREAFLLTQVWSWLCTL